MRPPVARGMALPLRSVTLRSSPLLPLLAAGAILHAVATGAAAQTVPLPTVPPPRGGAGVGARAAAPGAPEESP